MYRKFLSLALAATTLAILAIGTTHAAHGEAGVRAVTMWWLFFNNPDACVHNPGAAAQCGPVDVFGQPYLNSVAFGVPNPDLITPNFASGVGVVYASGALTDQTGRVRLAASIYRTGSDLDLSGGNLVDPLGLNTAFENVNAEVHVVVRDHETPVNGQIMVQLTNFLEPNCSDPTLLYFAGPNLCVDVVFAQFGPQQSGPRPMFAFHDDEHPLASSRAVLSRNGDSLQVVVETRIVSVP